MYSLSLSRFSRVADATERRRPVAEIPPPAVDQKRAIDQISRRCTGADEAEVTHRKSPFDKELTREDAVVIHLIGIQGRFPTERLARSSTDLNVVFPWVEDSR